MEQQQLEAIKELNKINNLRQVAMENGVDHADLVMTVGAANRMRPPEPPPPEDPPSVRFRNRQVLAGEGEVGGGVGLLEEEDEYSHDWSTHQSRVIDDIVRSFNQGQYDYSDFEYLERQGIPLNSLPLSERVKREISEILYNRSVYGKITRNPTFRRAAGVAMTGIETLGRAARRVGEVAIRHLTDDTANFTKIEDQLRETAAENQLRLIDFTQRRSERNISAVRQSLMLGDRDDTLDSFAENLQREQARQILREGGVLILMC
jgi:hypothetical protein